MTKKSSKHRSRLSAAIHETAAGLHRAGLMDKATMREFDASCLTPVEPLSAKSIVAIRRRADGSVLVTAPAFTGGVGPLGARAGAAAAGAMKDGPVSKAQGRFTIITNGEVLTNNSEDGASPHALGRQVHWEVGPASNKIPETLIRLQ